MKQRLIDKIDDWYGYKLSDNLLEGLRKLTIEQLEELLKHMQSD